MVQVEGYARTDNAPYAFHERVTGPIVCRPSRVGPSRTMLNSSLSFSGGRAASNAVAYKQTHHTPGANVVICFANRISHYASRADRSWLPHHIANTPAYPMMRYALYVREHVGGFLLFRCCAGGGATTYSGSSYRCARWCFEGPP